MPICTKLIFLRLSISDFGHGMVFLEECLNSYMKDMLSIYQNREKYTFFGEAT